MAVIYRATNNFGPFGPAVDPTTAAEPTQPAIPEGSPLNTDNPTTGRTQMAVQADLDRIEGPQQGTPYVTNVTAITLAGYAPGSLQYYRGV